MKITWIGHSCFKIEKDGYSLILDPYADGSVNGLAPIRETANLVLCSHEHGDHNARDVITIQGNGETPFLITKIPTYHDNQKGAKRGANIIHLISDGETKIAHLGDIGCMLEQKHIEQLQGLDLLLIPVGGFFTIDANQAAELSNQLNPRIVVPMHYHDNKRGFGFDVLGTVDAFTEKMQSAMTLSGSEIDSTDKYEAQVVVLKPKSGTS